MRDIIILAGGWSSSEREISLRSGRMVYESLARNKNFKTSLVILDRDELPDSVVARRDAVIFPITLGEFGEDGGLQALMDAAGLCYVGSGKMASALCMDKFATKNVLMKQGVRVVDGMKFTVENGTVVGLDRSRISGDCVIKPNGRGSSIEVKKINIGDIDSAVRNVRDGEFLLEKNIIGKDLTVGILDGEVLEVVEILPKHGFLNYYNKYTAGASDRICPAQIGAEATEVAKLYTETAYRACGCRDWARVDFMMDEAGNVFFLEINTLPGMTQTSFYPHSAMAAGIPFDELLVRLVNLAATRLRE
jgi:D-alanine-D-alanine ligase